MRCAGLLIIHNIKPYPLTLCVERLKETNETINIHWGKKQTKNKQDVAIQTLPQNSTIIIQWFFSFITEETKIRVASFNSIYLKKQKKIKKKVWRYRVSNSYPSHARRVLLSLCCRVFGCQRIHFSIIQNAKEVLNLTSRGNLNKIDKKIYQSIKSLSR